LFVAALIGGAFAPATAASSYVKITAPANGATVQGTVTIATTESTSVSWINVYVDSIWVASNSPTALPPYSVRWDSTTRPNGQHTVSVNGYNTSNNVIASFRISVNVQNQASATATAAPTPSPSPTPKPTPAPTATAAKNWVTITAPANSATVAGTLTVATAESASVTWINVFVDNVWVASNPSTASPPYSVTWNSTTVANGPHTVSVDGYSSTNAVIATTSVGISVQNALPTPTPTATRSAAPTATATPLPTQKPTPPPATATPSAAPTSAPTPAPTPATGVFYVAPGGRDSNSGSAAAPWLTIQHAVNLLLPGQQAVVAAGTYNERVTISSSGTAVLPIVLQAAAGADIKMLGFSISGSYWTVSGFDVSSQTNGNNGYGIYITGNASYDTVQNNYVHELCHEGIFMESTVSHISAIGNRIWRAEMAGINIDGLYDLVEGNEIWETQQVPVNLGGIYAGCSTPSGADADAMRFFGQHHDIRSNYLHNIYYGTASNPNPHVDCFQTWGSSARTVDDILIERNWCRWPAASTSIDDEVSMVEGLDGPVGTVTYSNNVFADMSQGINIGVNVSALRVWNNTWDHIVEEAVIFGNTRSAADQVINNIFYDVGSGGDSYACIPGGSPTIEANDFFMPSGSPGTWCSNAPYISVNPLFVNAGDPTGAGADYHLQSTSPVKDNGITLTGVVNDYNGTARPIGAGYSLGAFEK